VLTDKPFKRMSFCTFCKQQGHTLLHCYKHNKKVSISKHFDKTQTYGRNGEVIIQLVRKQPNHKQDITFKDAEKNTSKDKNGSSITKSITNQYPDFKSIKKVLPRKRSKCITQPAKPNFKVLAFTQPDIQLMRLSEAKIACDLRNQLFIYIQRAKRLQLENRKLHNNKKELHQTIIDQDRKINDMAEEIHHLHRLQGRKNNKVPTPGILPYHHVRLHLFDD